MRKLIPVLILVVLSACKKAEAPIAEAQNFAKTDEVATPGRVDSPQKPAERMIVRSADMRIIVGDTSKTVEAVTKAVEAAGGYVSASQVWREGELLRAKVTLRVPANRLTEILASIRGLAKRVDNESMASNEVTAEYTDLDSQVRNLEATETELRELLKVARLNSQKASEVLEVHQQVTMIRGQIEQAKGRMRYLSEIAAMSSITLDVVPDVIAQPVVEPGWRPLVIVRDASRALVGVMQGLATAAIWIFIYVLPIFGMLALLVALAWRARRLLKA